jgi:hypothetical protein
MLFLLRTLSRGGKRTQKNQGEKMTAAILRNKLHTYIDTLPDQSLPALEPLLSFMADEYWKPVIEPASPEEIAMIEESMQEYREHPETWTRLQDI